MKNKFCREQELLIWMKMAAAHFSEALF